MVRARLQAVSTVDASVGVTPKLLARGARERRTQNKCCCLRIRLIIKIDYASFVSAGTG